MLTVEVSGGSDSLPQWHTRQGAVWLQFNHQNHGYIGPKLINRYGANIFP